MYSVKVVSVKNVAPDDSHGRILNATGDSYTIECEEYHFHAEARQMLLYKVKPGGDGSGSSRYLVANRTFSKDTAEIYVTSDTGRTVDHVTF